MDHEHVRAAQGEALLIMRLFRTVNADLHTEARVWAAATAAAGALLTAAIRADGDIRTHELSQWQDVTKGLAECIRSYLKAVDLLADALFDGRAILLPATHARVTEPLEALDRLREIVARGLTTNASGLDAGAIARRGREIAGNWAAVCRASVAVADGIGDEAEGVRVLRDLLET